jgi:hypothetical protein
MARSSMRGLAVFVPGLRRAALCVLRGLRVLCGERKKRRAFPPQDHKVVRRPEYGGEPKGLVGSSPGDDHEASSRSGGTDIGAVRLVAQFSDCMKLRTRTEEGT